MSAYLHNAEEREALTDGAAMLRDAAKRLNPDWGEDVKARMTELRHNAELLESMAKAVIVQTPVGPR